MFLAIGSRVVGCVKLFQYWCWLESRLYLATIVDGRAIHFTVDAAWKLQLMFGWRSPRWNRLGVDRLTARLPKVRFQ